MDRSRGGKNPYKTNKTIRKTDPKREKGYEKIAKDDKSKQGGTTITTKPVKKP